jgi:hypothetical protein
MLELRRIDEDSFGLYFENKKIEVWYNCKNVSEDFLKYFFDLKFDWFAESGYVIETDDFFYHDIDMWEELVSWIEEGDWDWKKEVKSFKGNEGWDGETKCENFMDMLM